MVKAWCKAIKLKGNYGSHTLRKTWGYHQRVTYQVDIPTLMVCFNHATQKQTLDYLCIQPEEITNVFKTSYRVGGRDINMWPSIITKNHRPSIPIDPEHLPHRAVRPTGAARPVLGNPALCSFIGHQPPSASVQ
jgi:hypothetical protein